MTASHLSTVLSNSPLASNLHSQLSRTKPQQLTKSMLFRRQISNFRSCWRPLGSLPCSTEGTTPNYSNNSIQTILTQKGILVNMNFPLSLHLQGCFCALIYQHPRQPFSPGQYRMGTTWTKGAELGGQLCSQPQNRLSGKQGRTKGPVLWAWGHFLKQNL